MSLILQLLENRTKASRGEIEMVETLEELKELNKRKVVVNFDDMLHRYDEERESEAALEAAAEAAAELEDEQLIKYVLLLLELDNVLTFYRHACSVCFVYNRLLTVVT